MSSKDNKGFITYGRVEGGQHMYVNGEEVEMKNGNAAFDNRQNAAEIEAEAREEARDGLRKVFGIEI